MKKIQWESYRCGDELDLVDAFRNDPRTEWMELDQLNAGVDYLELVMSFRPIVSRQAAAIALATAITFAHQEGE